MTSHPIGAPARSAWSARSAWLARLAVVGSASLLLAGCGGGAPPAPAPPATTAPGAPSAGTSVGSEASVSTGDLATPVPTDGTPVGPPTSPVTSEPAGRTLDVAAFSALAAAPDTVVLDVRTPDEFAGGHVPGAVNVDLTSPDFEADLAGLDRGATYAIYCRTGHRSADAMHRMAAAGFTSLAHLDGGIEAWVAAGRAVDTGN